MALWSLSISVPVVPTPVFRADHPFVYFYFEHWKFLSNFHGFPHTKSKKKEIKCDQLKQQQLIELFEKKFNLLQFAREKKTRIEK